MRTILFTVASFCTIALAGCSTQVETTQSKAVAVSKSTAGGLQFTPLVSGHQVLPLRNNQQLLAPVLALMPHGGISEFFGVCKGRFRSAEMSKDDYLMVHLYAVPTSGRTASAQDRNKQLSLFLDLFIFNRTPTPAQLQRLNHVALTQLPCLNGNWAHGSDSVNTVDLMWIDSRQQQIPMIKVQMFGTVMSGTAGCYGLVVFPEGLQAKAVVQGFETYDQTMSGMNVSFSKDGRGFWVVRQDMKSYHMDFNKQHTTEKLTGRTYFDWNGRAFMARTQSGSTAPTR